MDEQTMRLGLLVEVAETHQQLVGAMLTKLRQHAEGLDAAVRDEIRQTLLKELRGVHGESQRAVQALRRIQRAANLRVALWSVGIAAMCSVASMTAAWWWLPSATEIQDLRQERDELLSGVERLNKYGARTDLRRCGNERRLCVRVDLSAGRFGRTADYYIVSGY